MISLWEHKATQHHARLAENITSDSATTGQFLTALDGLGAEGQAGLALTDRIIDGQAFLLSTNGVMCLSGLLMLVLIAPVWLAKGPFVRGSAAAH